MLRQNWSTYSKTQIVFFLCIPIGLGALTQEFLQVPGLTIAVIAISFAFEYEFSLLKAQVRQRKILDCWPIVIESLESAAVAGMSLLESLRDLGESEQLAVAKDFSTCCQEIDSGISFDVALRNLKKRLASPAADFTMELLAVTHAIGSAGYVNALRQQGQNLRIDSALASELAAKQGWVVGTAKLAVTAPWLIVAILAMRPENAALYRSLSGTALLLFGLLASAMALRLVYRIGTLSSGRRVFA